MTKDMVFTQSMWAMELRAPDGVERSVPENLDMIAEAGFDGISGNCIDLVKAADLARAAAERGLAAAAEWQCFPKAVDDLKPVIEFAAKWGGHHICLQADVRPRSLAECVPLLEGWHRLAEESPVPVWIETHRDRMTTDLYFTLDLLDAFPDMKLIADLSHFLVGREFAWPISDENHAYIHRILDNAWALHGRVASREQVQIEISFPQHKPLVNQFLDWWEYGMRSYLNNAENTRPLSFNCELGPRPYAITNRDGLDTTDRWLEAQQLRDLVAARWNTVKAGKNGSVPA
ncbi:sugar phosphate isomerase/epimerase [Sinorhizobium medicae]|uniref:sugar phosphate isomerase/epimerase n=1 Tax=Sinorhizobium medicae TaxID=110321 RepID=UPI002AF6B688|nr:sugar phosphate isomerase/epimerase [Sinorhizobium medicae]WQO46728.1 sugar phosphate isomerase/epimerase [Sinorhizobium medicae]WQO64152.1 sugar phosphate isomerase/epimerase [Sinorhizobium medicae]WQO74074.1 sugar phosphate isomerase/epimerase [Sinorhizobium medicae]WQO93345.1 sugar phosphate isomerase/epimerase [Sinorhizobium medicae]